MKKAIKRIFVRTLLMGLVTISGLVTIIFFPEPLFANKLEHEQFNVYSNDKIDENIKVVLNNALNLIKDSELYDERYTYDIFLSHNSFFNTIDDKFLGHGPSARATDNNITLKLEGYPEYVSRRARLLDSDYNLANEIDRCIDLESKSSDICIAIDEGGCKAPKYYYKSRLMTEYLMDIKSFSYDMILSDTLSENIIYAEMLKWKESINK